MEIIHIWSERDWFEIATREDEQVEPITFSKNNFKEDYARADY